MVKLNKEAVGKMVREFREGYLNLTAPQFARELGTNTWTISRIETGKIMPDFKLLAKMRDKYGLSPDRLTEAAMSTTEKGA